MENSDWRHPPLKILSVNYRIGYKPILLSCSGAGFDNTISGSSYFDFNTQAAMNTLNKSRANVGWIIKFRSTGNDHNTNSEFHSNSDLDLQMNCGKCIATYVHYGFLRENRSTMQKIFWIISNFWVRQFSMHFLKVFKLIRNPDHMKCATQRWLKVKKPYLCSRRRSDHRSHGTSQHDLLQYLYLYFLFLLSLFR